TNAAFPNPLAVTVKDGGGNPVQGVNVTFRPPPLVVCGPNLCITPPSGTFNGQVTDVVVVVTNSSGVASAPFTADGTEGVYSVTASSPGLSATFSLTNKC